MRAETMGRVVVAIKVENLMDLHANFLGHLSAEEVRTVEVPDALVDTGATCFSMPPSWIASLGLVPIRMRRARTAGGVRDFPMYSAVRVTVQGRDCICDVAEVPEDCPVLLGQVPLELLDSVIDPANRRLIGNPEHGGEHMIEMY